MGNEESTGLSPSSNVKITDEELRQLGAEYSLKRDELLVVLGLFSSLVKSGDGQIPLRRIIQCPAIVLNPLARELLYKAVQYDGISDRDEDLHVNQNMVLKLFSVLSPSATFETKLEALFRLYDDKQQGFWTERELYCLLSTQVGAVLTDKQLTARVQQTMSTIDLEIPGKITLADLAKIMAEEEVREKLTILLT